MLWTKKNVVRFYWAFWMVCIQNISCFLFSPESTFRLNAFMEFGSKREHLWTHNTSIKCFWLTTNVDWHQNKYMTYTENGNFFIDAIRIIERNNWKVRCHEMKINERFRLISLRYIDRSKSSFDLLWYSELKINMHFVTIFLKWNIFFITFNL